MKKERINPDSMLESKLDKERVNNFSETYKLYKQVLSNSVDFGFNKNSLQKRVRRNPDASEKVKTSELIKTMEIVENMKTQGTIFMEALALEVMQSKLNTILPHRDKILLAIIHSEPDITTMQLYQKASKYGLSDRLDFKKSFNHLRGLHFGVRFIKFHPVTLDDVVKRGARPNAYRIDHEAFKKFLSSALTLSDALPSQDHKEAARELEKQMIDNSKDYLNILSETLLI